MLCHMHFFNELFQNDLPGITSESKSLDLDQAQCFLWPDLGRKSLKSSVENKICHHIWCKN